MAFPKCLEVLCEYEGHTMKGISINVQMFPYPASFSWVLYSQAQVRERVL